MKIQNSTNWLERVRTDPASSSPTAAPNAFLDLVKSSLNPSTPAPPVIGTGAALTVQLLPIAAPSSDSLTAKLEGYLDLLDDYRRKLGDPRVSLKTLDPLVSSLERSREALTGTLESDPGGTELKDLMNRALVTGETEIMRFRRGDYLPI
jgi:hypothetical protein